MALHPRPVENADLNRKMTFFYITAADTTLHFKRGESLTINRAMLSFHSSKFDEMFFDKKSDVFIDYFDSETFKTFLDCLFEFKPYTVENALQIFQVAYEFKVEKSIRLCKEALNPSVMDENVCATLNLALYYDCDDLTENVVTFLKHNFGIINVIEDKKYCALLEPSSMSTLIKHIDIDSYILKKLYEWGREYLNKIEYENLDISSFFKKYDLLKNITLEVFESAQSIYEFNECVAMRKFFTSDEVLAYLKSNICDGQNKIPNKSEWTHVEKNFSVKEHFNFVQPFLISSSESYDGTYFLKIGTNKIVYFISPHLDRLYNALGLTWAELITCKVYVSWGNNNYKARHSRHHPYLTEEQLVSRNMLSSFNVTHKNKKFEYSFKLPVKPYYSELVSVDITYTFSLKCRILKTSLDVMHNAEDDGNLCFTSFVDVQRKDE